MVRPSRSLRRVHATLVGDDGSRARMVSNLGLRFDRFVPRTLDKTTDDEQIPGFLETFQLPGDIFQPYAEFYARWKAVLGARPNVAFVEWETASRLAFGLGDESVVEIGIRLQRTYGFPVVPGSAQKGLVRRYARQVFGIRDDEHHALFGEGGDKGEAGAVAFHDALWSPRGKGPFAVDVTAVHHPDYYQGDAGTAPPAEWDSPTPLHYLTAHGTFLFALEGRPEAVAFCRRVLALALSDWGIGGRTLKGYGRFRTEAALTAPAAAEVIWPGQVADTVATATPVAAPVALVPEQGRADGVIVRYQANTGEFQFEVEGLKTQVRAAQENLFADEQVADRARARCRKKGFVRARVTYERLGRQIVVRRIDPELPP